MAKYVLSAFVDDAGTTIEQQIKACVQNGISRIDIRYVNHRNLADIAINEVKEIKKQLDDNGISVESGGSPFGKTELTEDFAPQLEKYKQYIEKLHILQAKKVRVFSFYPPEPLTPSVHVTQVQANHQRRYEDKLGAKKYFGQITDRLTQFLENSGQVSVCLENEKGTYGNSPRRLNKLLSYFDGKVKLIFVPGNFLEDGFESVPAHDFLKNYIIQFHLQDFSKSLGKVVSTGLGDAKIFQILWNHSKNIELPNFHEKKNKKVARTVLTVVMPHVIFYGKHKTEGGSQEHLLFDSRIETFALTALTTKKALRLLGFSEGKNGTWYYARKVGILT